MLVYCHDFSNNPMRHDRMLLLQDVLSSELNVLRSDIVIRKKEGGKPYMLKIPFRDGLIVEFNTSYCQNMMLIGINPTGDIGVDIEKIEFFDKILMHDYFSENEKKSVLMLPLEKQNKMCYKIWTAKEAFLKAIGSGLSVSLDCVEVEFRQDFFSVKNIQKKYQSWNGRIYQIENKYICAVCSSQDIFPEALRCFQ